MTLGGTWRSCPFWSFSLRLRPLRDLLLWTTISLDSRYTWRHHTFHQNFMKCQFVQHPIGTSYTDHFHCYHLPVVSRLQKLRAPERAWFSSMGWRWMACDEECLPGVPGIPDVMILLMVQKSCTTWDDQLPNLNWCRILSINSMFSLRSGFVIVGYLFMTL